MEVKARNSHSLGILSIDADVIAEKNTSSSSIAKEEGKHGLKHNKKHYLVVYGGASPEYGPLGDTLYAELPDANDIGENANKNYHRFFLFLQPNRFIC